MPLVPVETTTPSSIFPQPPAGPRVSVASNGIPMTPVASTSAHTDWARPPALEQLETGSPGASDPTDIAPYRRAIWGHFYFLAMATGQVLPVPPDASNHRKLLHLLPALVSGLLLMARGIYMLYCTVIANGLSINWAYSNCLFFIALHGFVSSLVMMGYKYTNYFSEIPLLLFRATRGKMSTEFDRRPNTLRFIVISVFFLGSMITYCIENYIMYPWTVELPEAYGAPQNQTQYFRKSMFGPHFLFPLDIVLIMWGALLSVVCLCTYLYANHALCAEYSKFNAKLKALIADKKVFQMHVMEEVESQVIDFLALARFVNDNATGVISISFMGGLFLHIASQFTLKAFSDQLAVGKITFGFWIALSIMLLVVASSRPAMLRTMMMETTDMLYLDKGIWRSCKDESIKQITRDTINRLNVVDYGSKMPSAKASSGMLSIILIIVPFFVDILVAYKEPLYLMTPPS